MSSSRNLRIPAGVWGWRATVLAMVVVAVPSLATIELRPDARSLVEQAVISGLVVYPVALVAALLLYFHGRLTGDHGAAWLSVLLLAGSIKWMSAAGVRAAYPELAGAQASTFLLVDLLFALLALAIIKRLSDKAPPFDPAAMGFLIGLTVAGLRLGLAAGEVGFPVAPGLLAAGSVLLLGINLTVIHALLVHARIPLWARIRLAVSLSLLSAAVAAANPTIDNPLQGTVVLVSAYLGGVMLAGTSLALARLAIRDNQVQVHALHDRAVRAEAESRDGHERLHEINATVAGIASASRLIREQADLPFHKRGMLQDMVGSELARLERLMDDRDPESRDFDLDATIRPLIVAQQSLGQPVAWAPSGEWCHGRPDDTAEVLNVLLKNAARHAPGARVRVDVRNRGDRIEIHVSDNGPGVPLELAAQLFEWGVRHPRSPGQGIGLNLARRLMEEQGGFLRLVSTAATIGAVFVIGLPGPGQGHGLAVARAE